MGAGQNVQQFSTADKDLDGKVDEQIEARGEQVATQQGTIASKIQTLDEVHQQL